MLPIKRDAVPPSSRVLDAPTVLFMLGALVFLYGFLFIPPFLPRELTGDNMHFLLSGQRMYEGDTMYRDFFEFVTPGTALVNFFLFKLFGLRLWIPSLLCLLLGLGLVWGGVAIAKKLMRPGLALLPSAIFLSGLYWKGLDPTHHWYSLLMAMAALSMLMERRTLARIAAAGIFCGLSSCFTQTRGLAVAAGFGVYLWWEAQRRQEGWRKLLKKEAWLIASFLATLIAVNAYFIWKAGPARFLWCTVVYLFKYVPKQADFNTFLALRQCAPKVEWLSWRHPSYLVEWPLVWAVSPCVYILFFVMYGRKSEKPTEFWARPMLLTLAGSFLLLSILPGPSESRMAASALPGIILLVWFVDSWPKVGQSLLTAFAVGALLVALHTVARRRPVQNWILTTPQGRIVLTDQNTHQEYTWIQQHTRPRGFFYEPAYPDQYFILNLRNPTPLPFMTNCGYTTTGQVTEAIRGLEQHPVRYIIWTPSLEVLPAWEDPSDAHLGPLYDYIRSHYQQIKVFENSDQVWENKE